MNSYQRYRPVSGRSLNGPRLGACCCCQASERDRATYLPDVTANLPRLGQEHQRRHPLVGAEPGLAREVVYMSDEPFQEIFEPFIIALVVDPNCVGCDVVDGEVQQLWGLRVLSHRCVVVVLSPSIIEFVGKTIKSRRRYRSRIFSIIRRARVRY